MVSMQQFQRGIIQYIDSDIMPHLQGAQKLGVGVYVALAGNNLSKLIKAYMDKPYIQVLGVIDKDGNIDVDKLYSAAAPMFQNGEKYPVQFPIIGEIRFDKSDLEKLYQYVRG